MAVTAQLMALRESAKRLHQHGKLAEALQIHADALRLAPGEIGIWLSAGRLAHELGLQEVSLPHFEQAAKLDPRCYAAVEAARRICVAVGLYERAAHYSSLAQRLNPSDGTSIALALLLPSIAQSRDEIRQTRLRYEQGLDSALGSDFHIEEPDGVLGTSAFFLAYHGENDRALQMKAARMYSKAIPSLQMTAAHCIPGVLRRPGKIRVGFISRFFSAHSIFTTSHGLIDKLPRDRFDVYALRITPARDDEATAKIRASADHTVDLDPGIYRAREQIAALALDILFYQDIGMEPTSYFLAFARLAPVQCVSFGHPNTTGIPTVDYFISSDLFETAEAASHYSESLYLLHDLPTLAYYYQPAAAPAAAPGAATPCVATRGDFGLPADKTLYVCPQTLYKVHPDFDRLVRGILERDAGGLVVFINGQFAEFTDQLRIRFRRSLGPLDQRTVFLPRMNFPRFLELLAMADVVLDTVHFNGMNSSLECFAVGTPIVTLPTALQRGRHTRAMYAKMQIFDCVATDADDYIDIAVRIGTDRGCARSLRERIRSRNHVLFEDPRVVREFERFFIDALRTKIGEAGLPCAPCHH
jgi:protein O-GlcNAc transferase